MGNYTLLLANANWLQSSQRACPICRHPLWQEARDSSSRQARYEPVEIKQVWFNRERTGHSPTLTMKDIDTTTQKQRKAEVHALATRPHEQGGFIGKRLRVEERAFGTGASSLVFADEGGNVFGVIPRNQREQWQTGEAVILRTAKGSDGNLKAMVERVEE